MLLFVADCRTLSRVFLRINDNSSDSSPNFHLASACFNHYNDINICARKIMDIDDGGEILLPLNYPMRTIPS